MYKRQQYIRETYGGGEGMALTLKFRITFGSDNDDIVHVEEELGSHSGRRLFIVRPTDKNQYAAYVFKKGGEPFKDAKRIELVTA